MQSTNNNEKIRNQVNKLLRQSHDSLASDTDLLPYGQPSYMSEAIADLESRVLEGVCEGMDESTLMPLIVDTATHMSLSAPEFGQLASATYLQHLYSNVASSFSVCVAKLYAHVNRRTQKQSPLIAQDIFNIVTKHSKELDSAVQHVRDLRFDIFGLKTLERSYLLRIDGEVAERPQHMFMRVAIGIHKDDIPRVLETYMLMSQGLFVHATPTLFNAGTPTPQLSSCFLISMKEDSIDGIYDTLKTCARISKSAGGIGFSAHSIRGTGSYIRGTNGNSNGLVPMLRVFNSTARYVDQGGGRRKGSFACYLEPWHPDIQEWLDLKRNNGAEELRARDLFYALWIPDLFMRRVQARQTWTLFCPDEAPGLHECWGEEFDKLYEKYESEGRGKRVLQAEDLWTTIVKSQIETGTPYMLYKDSCNRKSNQQHLGTIKSSNLCAEIVQYTSKDEVAVCNLASLCLPRFVRGEDVKVPYEDALMVVSPAAAATTSESRPYKHEAHFDFEALHRMARVLARNLDRVIDVNHYPVPESKTSNLRHRPVGMGVQGLADVFVLLRLPFESEEAKQLNKDIFETIYHAACTESMELSKELGAHESFWPSPASRGDLQPDLWGVTPSDRWDWESLRVGIRKHGLRNSLLVAVMPTASTAQIMGNNECTEPYTSNIYTRRVLSGEFPVINSHLVRDLRRLGLWSEEMRSRIIAQNGSVQEIQEIPEEVRILYKTVWEINQKAVLDMAIGRGPYVDQSQSTNIFMSAPTINRVTSMHFYGWKQGLKTGMYYLRTRPAATAVQFTVDPHSNSQNKQQRDEEGDGESSQPQCLMCSA